MVAEITGLDYLKLTKGQRFSYKMKRFFSSIPNWFKNTGIKIGKFFKNLGIKIFNWFKDLVITFKDGDWKTRVSYLIMGFGNITRGQVLRGVLFLVFEIAFILYMIFLGGYNLSKLGSLGMYYEATVTNPDGSVTYGVNSFNVLLYGVLTIFFIIALVYTWNLNIKQNRINEQIIKDEKALATSKDDLRAVVDKDFHRTLLALPTLGIVIFTLLPIFFMILVAFTSYDKNHMPPMNLFGWVGFENFAQLFTWSAGGNNFAMTFGEILLWTLVWSFFATFTNYFLGMLVAMLISASVFVILGVFFDFSMPVGYPASSMTNCS